MSDTKPTDLEAAAAAVEAAFFDPARNGVDVSKLTTQPFLVRAVERLRRGEPTVLPYRPVSGGATQWIGVARTEREFRALREGLDAFVGDTWARVSERRAALDHENPIHSALDAYSGGRVLLVRGDEVGIYRGLQRMLRAWAARPARVHDAPRAPGVLRRAFEVSLVAGDARGASDALRALRDSGTLDRKNAVFLEVQRLASFGQWHAVLALPDLDDLVRASRPAAVTDAVLRAAYHVHLAPIEAQAGESRPVAEDGLRAYRGDVGPRLAPLLDGLPPLRSRGALVVAAAAAVDRGDLDAFAEWREQVLAGGEMSALIEGWSASLAERAGRGASAAPSRLLSGGPLAQAEALGRFDKEAGFEAALGATRADPAERAALLLSLANDLRSLHAIREVARAVDALSADDRARLESASWVSRVLADLAGETRDVPPDAVALTSWGAWLERLLRDAAWRTEDAIRAARRGAHEWSADGLWAGRSSDEVADALLSVPENRAEALSAVLPLLVASLGDAPVAADTDRSLVYRALLQHIAYELVPTESDVRIYADLMPGALAGRVEAESYAEILDGLKGALDARGAVPPPEVVLDAIDATLVASCPTPESRLGLIVYAASAAERYEARWNDADYALLVEFATEAGHPEAVPPRSPNAAPEDDSPPTDPLRAYADQYVALYTLTETAAMRAQQVLERLAPGVRVATSAAHGGSDRLKAMARGADVFVMVTWSATHAATDFIETHRAGKPLLRPRGKGTASILRSLRAHAG